MYHPPALTPISQLATREEFRREYVRTHPTRKVPSARSQEYRTWRVRRIRDYQVDMEAKRITRELRGQSKVKPEDLNRLIGAAS